jgi:hypothetical protein
MGDALATLEEQYFFIRDNQFDLLDACQTDEQRNVVLTDLVTARRNYWNSINKMFHDDDPKVAAIVKQTKAAEEQAKAACDSLDDIAKTLSAITKAVQFGTQLASMAA